MSFSDAAENAIMLLIFNATAWADYADNDATSPQTLTPLTLHTTPGPADAGTMSTNEITYSGYARKDWNRASGAGGWTVTGGSVSPQANIDFAAGTAGTSPVATHFGVGKAGGGALPVIVWGTITPNITTGEGVTPRISTASTITLD